ncbi:MAG: GntG family PLP-dependent aldolase [Bacteroidota bacterium]
MIADLRSDTLTKPTPAMLEYMMQAPLGDDVFGEDPSVTALEKQTAEMLGMDEAIFCPSGTMTNQIAIRLLTQPQDEVICDKNAHIYLYEGGGITYNSFVSVKLLSGERGKLNVSLIEAAINPDDIHQPVSKLVALENTMNKGGGAIYHLEEIKKIATLCKKNKLSLHLDGARLFNALVETGEPPVSYGQYFDTISICLSKGLGAPVGSLLLFNNIPKQQALRIRKVFGGGMRQAGIIAAAGSYALTHHIKRLKEDHKRARVLAEALRQSTFAEDIYPVDTNIVIFQVKDAEKIVKLFAKNNVKCIPFSDVHVRLVTHLDFNDDMLDHTYNVIRAI